LPRVGDRGWWPRRAHGPETGVLTARAAFIGGCVGTSNTAAGLHADIPTYGTQAHSWIMAFADEAESFRRYADVFPESAVLLIDTYDVAAGAVRAAELGPSVRGVRIDSGDLYAESVRVRHILDERGLAATQILASSDLNEYIIDDLLRRGAPIDAFGVGTELVLSPDAPSIGGVYKLVAMTGADGRLLPKAKSSASKETLPGRKQVYRHGADGSWTHDVIGLRDADDAAFPGSERLLVPVMADGRRLSAPESLPAIQARARINLARLPELCRELRQAASFPVTLSPALERLRQEVRSEHAAGSSNEAGGAAP
ncbi:MAG TPA: nicotinate phosphoribosyltransferase, partial [Acidobacteriota bacterium]|nr:nicotinate phosphoribosyltransferase [Acidobacteriota bacterium]